MKTYHWLTTLIVCGSTSIAMAAATPPVPGVLEFIAANRDRQFTGTPHEVLAFYYTWYGRPERHGKWIHWGGENTAAHEIPESAHYPARGAYDSQDRNLIEAHIAEAKANGVTGFITTWWGQRGYEDQAVPLLLDCAQKQDFKISVYWETAPGQGQEQIDRAIRDLVFLVRTYGSKPAFLKAGRKPVIFAYGRVMNEVPFGSWPAILSGARAQAGDFQLIADGYNERFARLFEGVHTYNICAEVQGKTAAALREWSARHYMEAVQLARRQGRISCATVIPGYDDTKIRKPGINAKRLDGQTYRVLWEEAIRANPDWVLITSWNEWHEGSEIEPSWEDGETYLKLTAECAAAFLAAKPARATTPRPTAIDAATKQRIQTRFKGRTIGVLPDFGDAAFWLTDAGLAVKELSWAELVDAAVFNPEHFPLVLHAGGERYQGTVKQTGDVPAALQRYLASGGILISVPHEPYPFFHDESQGRPDAIANRIGLPVQGGWEKPPAGAKLAFHFNTNALPGLPASAPFPVSGDLRWRPAQPSAGGPTDLYTSLASLRDAGGRSLGDGIAYIEHRTGPIAGGRTLYVWMRMAEVAGADKLMPAVLEFAGEKIGRTR